jgi:hypothetical protein
MSRYLIRVEGQLSPGVTSAFPSLDSQQYAETVLHGQLEDQSALAGVLEHLRRLGVDVVEVHRIPGRRAAELARVDQPSARAEN